MDEGQVEPAEVREALQRMLSRKPLSGAPQASAMLRHVVERTLEGRAGELKAYTIAVDALGKPRSFDPQIDPGVRVLARSLRKSLAEYYANEGRDEVVEIAIPTGGYEPVFRRRDRAQAPSPGWGLAAPLAAAALALVAAILWFAVPHGSGMARDLHLPRVERFEGPRLLVQPFAFAADPVRDPPAEELAAGITAEIVAAMSAYPWLSVVQLPEPDQPLADLAGRTADESGLPYYVLSGRVAERSGALVVAVSLTSFPQLVVKWSGVFREPLGSAGAERIERDLSGRIAALVGSENGIVPELVKSDPPPSLAIDVDAFRCFMESYSYWREPDAAGHLRLSQCLPQAVARNPGYAEAWAALALVRMDEARFARNPRPGADPWAEARAASERAIALSPLSPVVLRAAMAIAIEQPRPDLAAFERYGRRNLQLRPNDANALAEFGGRLAVSAGKWEDGMRLVARAFDLNPAPPGWYYFAPAANALMLADDEALATAAAAMTFPEPFAGLLIRAIAAAHAGDAPMLARLKTELSGAGVADALTANRQIEARSFEPGLKARLKLEAARLFGEGAGAQG